MSAGICAGCELLRQQLRVTRDKCHDLASRVMVAEADVLFARQEIQFLRDTIGDATREPA